MDSRSLLPGELNERARSQSESFRRIVWFLYCVFAANSPLARLLPLGHRDSPVLFWIAFFVIAIVMSLWDSSWLWVAATSIIFSTSYAVGLLRVSPTFGVIVIALTVMSCGWFIIKKRNSFRKFAKDGWFSAIKPRYEVGRQAIFENWDGFHNLLGGLAESYRNWGIQRGFKKALTVFIILALVAIPVFIVLHNSHPPDGQSPRNWKLESKMLTTLKSISGMKVEVWASNFFQQALLITVPISIQLTVIKKLHISEKYDLFSRLIPTIEGKLASGEWLQFSYTQNFFWAVLSFKTKLASAKHDQSANISPNFKLRGGRGGGSLRKDETLTQRILKSLIIGSAQISEEKQKDAPTTNLGQLAKEDTHKDTSVPEKKTNREVQPPNNAATTKFWIKVRREHWLTSDDREKRGQPVADQLVVFEFQGKTYKLTSGSDGLIQAVFPSTEGQGQVKIPYTVSYQNRKQKKGELRLDLSETTKDDTLEIFIPFSW